MNFYERILRRLGRHAEADKLMLLHKLQQQRTNQRNIKRRGGRVWGKWTLADEAALNELDEQIASLKTELAGDDTDDQ